MDDPCFKNNLDQLRDIARGKVPGFSKMKKNKLCTVLGKMNLLPLVNGQGQAKPTQVFQGISPPEWDFDKMNPIPNFLLPYDYLYGAGASVNEVVRHFILPDNFPLVGIQLPAKGGKIPPREFEITVDDYLNQLDVAEVHPNLGQKYLSENEEVDLHIIHIKGLRRGRGGYGDNRIAPRVGSPAWFNLLLSLHIVGIEGAETKDAELRREYQIITTPAVFDLSPTN